MKPVVTRKVRSRIHWNGGRNGYSSFIIGASRSPGTKLFGWCVHIYLGRWVWTIDQKDVV